ncbi:ParB N-terminal domain-containing protein (plasmid) [Kitasatospora sp. NBC_01246]|uniref:ParB/RepB/Spo0J family partition protein n=1 Tax=Kitasatospora sp. NBC_01246 TaxID=2903570 RepID=UPI002E2FF112|nr:hypothetical protein [Kitasatospora sp. NBC_01246]
MATAGLGGRSLTVARNQQQQIASKQPTATLDDLLPSPTNGRKRLRNIESLAATIASDGLSTALTVIPAAHYIKHHPEHAETVKASGKPYVVLGGHRRLDAAKQAGVSRVAINVVFEVKSVRISSLQENLQREPLTPVEEGEEFQQVMKEEGLSQRGLAKRLGAESNKRISQTYISQRIALLKLTPEFQDDVDDQWSHERETGITLKFAAEVLARLTHEAQTAYRRGDFTREDVIFAVSNRDGGLTVADIIEVLAERDDPSKTTTVEPAVIAAQSHETSPIAEPAAMAPRTGQPSVSTSATDVLGTAAGRTADAGDCAAITPPAPGPGMPAQRTAAELASAAAEPEPEASAAAEPEPEPEPEASAAAEPEPEPEPEASAAAEPEPEPEPEASAAAEPEPEPEPDQSGSAEPGSTGETEVDRELHVDRVLTLAGDPEQVALAVYEALTADELESIKNLLS